MGPNPLPQPAVPAPELMPASSSESVKIRLKPRLNEAPASDRGSDQPAIGASSAAVAPVLIAEVPLLSPPVSQEVPAVVAEPVPATPTLRVRLQARPNPSENSTVPAAMPVAGLVDPPVVIPAFIPPLVAEAPAPVIAAPASIPSDSAVDSNKFKLKPSVAPAPAASMMIGGLRVSSKPPVAPAGAPPPTPHLSFRQRPNRKPLIAALVVVGLAAGAYYGSDYLSNAATSAAPKLTAPAAELASSITHSETLNKLATMPGEMIQKAKDSISARRDQEQSRVDASAVGEISAPVAKPVTPPRPASAHAPSSAPLPFSDAAATATRSFAPGLTATMKIEAASDASPAFREFVANARISGIAATRVIINDRLVRAGEMAEVSLGIRFDGYNRDTKQLRFSDRNGAHVLRRY